MPYNCTIFGRVRSPSCNCCVKKSQLTLGTSRLRKSSVFLCNSHTLATRGQYCSKQGTQRRERSWWRVPVCEMVQDKDEGLWDGLFSSVACCQPSQEQQTVLAEQNPMLDRVRSVKGVQVKVKDSNKWPQWRSRQPKSPSSSAEAQKSSPEDAGCNSDSKTVRQSTCLQASCVMQIVLAAFKADLHPATSACPLHVRCCLV